MRTLLAVPALIWSALLAFVAGLALQFGAHAPPQLALAYGGPWATRDLGSLERNAGFNPNHERGFGKPGSGDRSVDAVRQLRCLWSYPPRRPLEAAGS